MGNKVCHGFWCVWRQGKDISYFGLIYSCGKIDLILEDIPFVSICSYMLVISKDLQTGYATSGLNSYYICRYHSSMCIFENPRWESCPDYSHLSFCVSKEVSTFTWGASDADMVKRSVQGADWDSVALIQLNTLQRLFSWSPVGVSSRINWISWLYRWEEDFCFLCMWVQCPFW